ncbi:carbonic anhydrase/acetyltransferase-like protein (isoleucine patch superfamily) [Caldalkalibacillus uzonensis]|uniref:Carbonic anhydrase/acetyltransferase-like protein (Isoleucine patch superfamily) n=1 Tax=Caldalkalibacillus uzonensis TaxID=353224 RepID=A0ABU0CT30_9BACI|nr:gamma carbonic anhydrase family protein [Caldalkalibacillus uzonensis]MDQ0338192.1 carbonic anhydrase/acetyltransferase-like protein (isoleucine patch superfamily) [Caldalkalibacillus uzonensis]
MLYSFKGKTPQLHPSAYIAPGAKLIGDITVGEDSTIWFNAVLRGDNAPIIIGKGSNIQDGTIVHVDPGYPVKVGDNVTVGHNVILHGCTVEDGALIGMGATILNGAVIGKGALIAAGAVVPEGKVIEPGMLVAGVPAKPLRKLSEENMKRVQEGASHYIERGKLYTEEQIKE